MKAYFVPVTAIVLSVSCLNTPSEDKPCYNELPGKDFPSMDKLFSTKEMFEKKCIYYSLFDEKCLHDKQGINKYDTIMRFLIADSVNSAILRFEKSNDRCFVVIKKIPPMFDNIVYIIQENNTVSYNYFYRKIKKDHWETLLHKVLSSQIFTKESLNIDGHSLFFEMKTYNGYNYGFVQYPLSPSNDTLSSYIKRFIPNTKNDIYINFY
jgi:hypothetical protein